MIRRVFPFIVVFILVLSLSFSSAMGDETVIKLDSKDYESPSSIWDVLSETKSLEQVQSYEAEQQGSSSVWEAISKNNASESKPAPTSEPEPQPEPAPTSEPEPQLEPAPTSKPEPQLEPAPTSEQEP